LKTETYDVDIVIAWVDGNDPAWLAERRKHDDTVGDSSDVRFRDWGLLRYFFRSVENFAPWVRKIHFVTWGHVPEWLDLHNPKLHIVRHEDFIPKQYLPTFNSHTIELNFHRIEGLADRFIYFNDDILFTKPTPKSYFFRKGLPCDSFIMDDIYFGKNSIGWINGSNTAVLNTHFKMRDVVKKHWKKVFCPDSGFKKVIRNLLHYRLNVWFPGFYYWHVTSSFLKKTYEEVWNASCEVLDETCRCRFREKTNVNQFLVKNWQLVTGEFSPRGVHESKCFHMKDSNVDKVCKAIINQKYYTICINDTPVLIDVEKAVNSTKEALEVLFPVKSDYEK